MKASQKTIFPGPKSLLYLLLLATIQFIGLTFGEGNQVEQFSIVNRLLNPSLAANDFYLNSAAEPGQPRYYYSLLIAALTNVAPLEAIIHTLMLFNGWALGLVTFIAARHLLRASETAAAISSTLVLLNYGISIGFAGYLTFSNFQPASLAITASLAGILLLTVSRLAAATAFFVFSVIIHPTIGAEAGALGYAAVLTSLLIFRQPVQWLQWIAYGGIFLGAIFVFWAIPNLGVAGLKLSQSEFHSILIETRAPHHYLGLDFPKRRWLEALLFIMGTGWIGLQCRRYQVPAKGLVLLFTLSLFVALLCIASLYFVDIAESRLWATAQLFRLVLLIKWAGYLLMGMLAYRWVIAGHTHLAILAGVLLLATADSISYAMLATLVTQLFISLVRLNKKASILATVPAVLFAIYHHMLYGSDEQLLRLVIAFAVLAILQSRYRLPLAATASCILVIFILLLSISGLPFPERFRTTLTIDNRIDDQTAIAKLAKDISEEHDLWLIPPNLEQFRFVAGRAVVVDFTSVPFSDEGLREWNTRMKAMFGDTEQKGFKALQQMMDYHRATPATEEAHHLYNATFAVLFADTPTNSSVLARAGKYKIIKLGG